MNRDLLRWESSLVPWATLLAVLVAVSLAIPESLIEEAGTVVFFAMLLPINYFPIFYTFAFRWWGGHLGKALFIKGLGLALVLDIAIFYRHIDSGPWIEETRFVAYLIVLIGTSYLCVVMTRIRVSAKANGRVGADRRRPGTRGEGDDTPRRRATDML